MRSKVFGIGLSRTGTTSLTLALKELGLSAEHFPDDPTSQSEITAHLAAPGTRLELSVLESIDALTDTPVAVTFTALDQTYPNSRFIATVRDEKSWLASCENYWNRVLSKLSDRVRPETERYIRLVNRTVYGTEDFDANLFRAAYIRHQATLSYYFAERPDDVLVMNICGGDGWPPLCDFLGVNPPSKPFPHANLLPRLEQGG